MVGTQNHPKEGIALKMIMWAWEPKGCSHQRLHPKEGIGLKMITWAWEPKGRTHQGLHLKKTGGTEDDHVGLGQAQRNSHQSNT